MRKGRLLVNLLLLTGAVVSVAVIAEIGLRVAARLGLPEEIIPTRRLDEEYDRLRDRLDKQVAESDGLKSPYMLLHPYFGYTNVPGRRSVHGVQINTMGFADPHDFPYRKEADNEYVIGVFGGSVAEILTVMSSSTMKEVLGSSPVFTGRKIVLLNCATGAYKQPQQLQILTYLLSQGMEFDCVINVDGFNEVAIAGVNRKKGTNIFYPAAFYWDEMIHYLTSGTEGLLNNPRYIELVYQRTRYIKKEIAVLDLILESLLQHSSLARFILIRRLGALERSRSLVENELKNISRSSSSEWVKKMEDGPVRTTELAAAAENWADCSLLMRDICAVRSILYIHVFQPNQYDPRGKSLTPGERAVAYDPKSPFRNGGEWGYPLLRKEMVRLIDGGVAFLDLSLIFNRVEGDIYVDDCCHFNRRGNDLMMAAIAAAVIEESEEDLSRTVLPSDPE